MASTGFVVLLILALVAGPVSLAALSIGSFGASSVYRPEALKVVAAGPPPVASTVQLPVAFLPDSSSSLAFSSEGNLSSSCASPDNGLGALTCTTGNQSASTQEEDAISAGSVMSSPQNDAGSETPLKTWQNFASEVSSYAFDLDTFIVRMAAQATAWSLSAEDWHYSSSSLSPFNMHLPSATSSQSYLNDVSSYAYALSEFATKLVQSAHETVTFTSDLQIRAATLSFNSSGWSYAPLLASKAEVITSDMAYLADFAGRLSSFSSDWLDNVEYMAFINNSTSPLIEEASTMASYAEDMSATWADWADYAAAVEDWMADWATYAATTYA